MAAIPQAVLGDALAEARNGRRVRAAVFTTFSFDPGFFELHVLPLLFDRMSQIERVKRIQLEDQLQTADVAVYYDRTALSQDALPAQTNFRRIDVRRHGKGVFHPKLVLLLVENAVEDDDDEEPTVSLIVGAMSANLTRAGWWENVETGHFEEVQDFDIDNSRIPFRKDLLSIIRRIRDLAPEDNHSALDAVREFLLKRTRTDEMQVSRHAGRYFTRIFAGQQALPAWLEEIGIRRGEWNLEIISPYFDKDHASTLTALCDIVEPKEVRVFLPTDRDGSALVSQALYDAIQHVAYWSGLPDQVVRPSGRGTADNVPDRRVHAKVYRLWQLNGPEVVLTGSVNLTTAAHSHAGAGNLEAAFLVGIPGDGRRNWWLRRLEGDPKEYTETAAAETEEAQEIFIDVTLRFDWRSHTFSYRVEGDTVEPFEIATLDGRTLARVDEPTANEWRDLPEVVSREVETLLVSTSLLDVTNARGSWHVLVREEGMAHRPSLIAELTPEEILMYWSLLSPEQREAFIEKKMLAEARQEGLATSASGTLIAEDTVFDRFAGVYHAFGRLAEHVERAITQGDDREAEARLFGAKYDSLPVLLDRLSDREAVDDVMTYVTFLCAKQVRDRVRRRHGQFWKSHRDVSERLDALLAQIPQLRAALLSDDPERDRFLAWYERMFMREATVVEEPT